MTEETKLVNNDEDSTDAASTTPSKASEVADDSVVDGEANGDIKDSDSAVKKGKKRKKSIEISEEFYEKRERSSRGAKTKAALQISLTSIKDSQYNFDVGQDNDNLVAVRRGRPKKIKYPDEISDEKVMSCSPLKVKAGPKSKKIPLKPGPRRKRGRNFQLEDLYLDQPGLDEDPDLTKTYYDKKLNAEADKAKLKALVAVLDLKNAKNPSTRAAFDLAHDYWLTTGQFGGSTKPTETIVQGNIVTVSYQRPPRMNTFNHKPDPTRVVISDFSRIQAQKAAAKATNITNVVPKPMTPTAPAPVAKATPDPLKPPPITNYMSVKIEILMNCLEKMYHNHLPLNAFTSRFPNARAKAALTLMLDSHRADCEACDKILEEANVGIFHGDEAKMKMDLEAFGPVIPTQAPVVDLSQYPDSVAEMKKLLVEKDAKIRALEKRIEALNKDVKTDEIDKLDLVEMLDGVNEPTMEKFSGKFLKTAGYRLVDLRLLRMALEICQTCHHGKMTLAEMSPEVEGNQEDAVTRLAFICTICGPKAIFPTSPFSKNYPTNYSLNKLLLPLLGPSAYFQLSQFLQTNPDAAQEVVPTGAFGSNQKPQLLVSVDHAYFDFARPFDPPPPTDPEANIVTNPVQSVNASGPTDPDMLKFKPIAFCDLKATTPVPSPSATRTPSLPPLRPIPEPEGINFRPKNGDQSNGSIKVNMSSNMNNVITRKIKACAELPPGCRIVSVAPGTKLVSKDVTYSTVQKTGLSTGCYRVKEPGKYTERILIIKDQEADENPVIVTELERNHRQIDVRDTVSNAPFRAVMPASSLPAPQADAIPKKVINFGAKPKEAAPKPAPKKRKKDSDSNDSDEGEIELSSDDDSDDPSWGSSRRKKKNDAKAKKRRKNKY